MNRPSPYAVHHETGATAVGDVPLPGPVLDAIRRSRRHPAPTQHDYIHLRYLRAHIRAALEDGPRPPREALDIFCGTRPYEDLLPPGVDVVGMDVNRRYGEPDVVSDELLPFDDQSFDLVSCYEGFHYARDPAAAISEIWRVLRPGGQALVTVPLVWEYDRTILERRYTGPELVELFDGWEGVRLLENGGRAASWALLTGGILKLAEESLARRVSFWRAVWTPFAIVYGTMNAAAMQLDRVERRFGGGPRTLPPNLLVTARRPSDG